MSFYIGIAVLSIVFYVFLRRKRSYNLNDEHCLVTGGSSGIGLEICIQAAKMGANVTILARSKERLEIAKDKVQAAVQSSKQKIQIFSTDVAKDTNLVKVMKEAEKSSGPISLLFNCAGTSISSRFDDTPLEVFQNMLDVNLMGSVNVTHAVLPSMKQQRKGSIVFVSSLAGLIGLYGYTAYSASKFALRGLAESLQMEVKLYNISITLSFPPDTDTPGFAEENKCKPLETARISESGGLFSAERVARQTLNDVLDKKFLSSVGMEGWFLCNLCCGNTPVKSLVELLIQVFTMGLSRIGGFIFQMQCDHTIKKCAEERKQQTTTN